MALYGYARVSTVDQQNSLETQTARLKAAGCEIVRHDEIDGTTAAEDRELGTLMTFLRAGDVLVVTKVDRLARSGLHLQTIVRDLRERGIGLRVLDQGIAFEAGEAPSPYTKALLDVLGAWAELETAIRRERQLEGIAAAKAKGVYKGRAPTIDAAEVRRLHADGVGPADIARRLKISRNSVYRLTAPKTPITTATATLP